TLVFFLPGHYSSNMLLRLISGVIFTLLLIGLLGTTVYVALQRQDIRQQAHKGKEFIQLTPPIPKNNGRAQYGVVVNNLDSGLEYRLVHEIKYEGENNSKPADLHKTGKISENKTYKFHFPYPGCKIKAHVKIILYSRTPNGVWEKGEDKDSEIKQKCPGEDDDNDKHEEKKNDNEIKKENDELSSPAPSPESESSPTATSEPVLGATDLSDIDPEAIKVEDLEDFSVIETENKSAQSAALTPPSHPGTAFQISSGADDVNEDGNNFDVSGKTVWVGDGESSGKNYMGLRFTNITIPQGVKITSAKFDMYNEKPAWINMDFKVFAEASDNSQTFSTTSKPSTRQLTSSSIDHHSNSEWKVSGWQEFEDISPNVQEIVSRPGWKSGNRLA
ncbi:MAG: hypothetical protein AAB874_02365, partial [Patescibacteria group bacterium]